MGAKCFLRILIPIVSKLFILVWSYEGMKVMNLGYDESSGKFSITLICHIFITHKQRSDFFRLVTEMLIYTITENHSYIK